MPPVSDEFQGAGFEPPSANDAELEPEVAQQAAYIILDNNRLLLQELLGSQQGSALLALPGLHMHRTV